MTFRFGEPIVSPLTVSYDREKHDFAVTDRAGNEGKAIETESGDIHKSPMQRGDI